MIALLVVVLVAEEIQLVDYSHLDRGAERQRLAAFPPPPASCRAFFVQSPVDRPSTGSPTVDSLYLSNVDAMMLAEVWAVPTVNGFATFNPPDWNFASVGESSYLARVGMYLDGRALHDGICGLDMAQHAWITDPHLPIPALKAGATVDLGQAGLGADQYLGRGWNPPDPTGRWGQGRWADGDQAALSFAVPNSPPGASLTLQLDATAYARPGRTPNPIAVDINGTAVTTWHPEAGAQVLSVTIPPELMRADNQVWLRLSVIPPRTWFGPPKSATRLGLFARSFRVVPATKASTDPP